MSKGSDDPSAELLEQDTVLPKLAVGDQVWSPDKLDQELILLALDAKGHQTSPPARYTEASLVKKLEEEGIGRPSTYAPTVATIQRRGYISRQGKALVPSFTAFAVTRLLRNHFGDYVDLAFTAEMEEILDKISNGEKDWLVFLAEFYRGDGKHPGLEHLVEDKGQAIEYPIIELGHRSRKQPADSRAHWPLRPVPANGFAGRRRAARVVAGRSGAGRPDAREGDCAAQGQGPGAEVARRRSGERPARLRHARPLRRLRAARRDAGRPRHQAAPRVARPRSHRRDDHARRGAEAAVAAARTGRRRRRRADPGRTSAASART